MFILFGAIGCFDSLLTVGEKPESVESPLVKGLIEEKNTSSIIEVEKKNVYSIPKVREYTIHHIYESIPDIVYAANSGINLRNRATANSSVLVKIPLGHRIDVLEQDKKVTLGSRTDHWYHVRVKVGKETHEGYLFGSTITPYRIAEDWDNDGEKEAMFALFNERQELLLRIHDPNGESTWSNTGAYTDGEFTANQVVVKAMPRSIAGLPLLKIEVTNEKGNIFWTKFASYHHGKILRALEYVESETESTYSKKEPKFGPKKLSVLSVDGMVQVDGSEKQSIITKRYRYRNGIFLEKNASAPIEKVVPSSITN